MMMVDIPAARLEYLLWARPDKLRELVKRPVLLTRDLVATSRLVATTCRGVKDPDKRLEIERSLIEAEASQPNEAVSEEIANQYQDVLEKALDEADEELTGQRMKRTATTE